MTLKEIREQSQRGLDHLASQSAAKRVAAQSALNLVENGMVLGLGTGSTVAYFLEGLRDRVRQGLQVKGVSTSESTAEIAEQHGIELVSGGATDVLENDLCVDGADRVDDQGHLIKGGGGALLREKLVAVHSRHRCVMVDPTKLVVKFDDSFALPVECFPFGHRSTATLLSNFGCRVSLRQDGGVVFVTDNGNLIADCSFDLIADPSALEERLCKMVGVAETGLFCNMADTVIVGRNDEKVFVWTR